MSIESILNTSMYSTSNTAYANDSASTGTEEMDSNDFMTLFLAQLEYQDPLEPMDDTEMLSQLAEFSTLEELEAVNASLQELTDTTNAQLVNSAVSFLGMDVVAQGDSISKGQDGVSDITYTLDGATQAASAYIYDEGGALVDTVPLEALSTGEHTFTWDGLTEDGEEAPDGSYSVSILRQDEQGELYAVPTQCEGRVTGLTSQNGSTVLELGDGRQVDLLGVSQVNTPAAAAS